MLTRKPTKAWWGLAFLPHPWWKGLPFLGGFKFEAGTEVGGIQQPKQNRPPRDWARADRLLAMYRSAGGAAMREGVGPL